MKGPVYLPNGTRGGDVRVVRFIDHADQIRAVIYACRTREQLAASLQYCQLMLARLRESRYPLTRELDRVVRELVRERGYDIQAGVFLRKA